MIRVKVNWQKTIFWSIFLETLSNFILIQQKSISFLKYQWSKVTETQITLSPEEILKLVRYLLFYGEKICKYFHLNFTATKSSMQK